MVDSVPPAFVTRDQDEQVRIAVKQLRLALRPMLLALVLQGCDSSSGPGVPQVQLPPVVPGGQGAPPGANGHYRGSVTIGANLFHAEAIFTADSLFRLYVGAAMADDDWVWLMSGGGVTDELLHPATSTQVFGQLGANGNEHLGSGMVVGQICPATTPGRFCDQIAEVDIDITGLSVRRLQGEIRITGNAGQETWTLDLGEWSAYYSSAATVAGPSGTYKEKLASFVQGNDVIVTVDATGRMFFQDATSGCIGNGNLTPHLDGRFYVYDVVLAIENCSADYDYLNSQDYVGLATETQNGYWGYDSWLLVIAAAPAGESPAAITLYANRF